MSSIENYPALQFIISILLMIVAVSLMITSLVIKKNFGLEAVFSVTIFSMGIFLFVADMVFMLEAIFDFMIK